MSHIQTLNLLNNRMIVADAHNAAAEMPQARERFTQVFEKLRVEESRSAERSGAARRAARRDAESSADRVDPDRAARADRDGDEPRRVAPERAAMDQEPRPEQDEASPVREASVDAAREQSEDEHASTAEDRRDRSTQIGPSQAEPRDPSANAPEAQTAEGLITEAPGPSDESEQENVSSGQDGSQTAGDAQPRESQGPSTNAQQAAALLAQLGREGAGMVQVEQAKPLAPLNTPGEISTGATAQQDQTPTTAKPVVQQPVPPGATTPDRAATETVAGRVGPGGSAAAEVEARASQASTIENSRPQTTAVSGEPILRKPQPVPTTDQTQTEMDEQENQRSTGKHARTRPKPVAPRHQPVELKLTPAQIKAESTQESSEPAATDKPKPPQPQAGGHITRMWTGPARNEPTASTPMDGKADMQNRSLAAEATRQIGRFIIQPTGHDEASDVGRGGPQTATSTASASDQPVSTTPSQPAVVPPSAGGDGGGILAASDKAEAPAPTAETPAQGNIDRMARVLRAHIGTRDSHVRIQLEPPELGRVRIDIRMRNDTLLLQVETETPAARDLLNSRLTQLREALQQQGIIVERANVQLRDAVHEAPQPREQQQQAAEHPRQNQNQEAPGQAADQSADSDRRDGAASGEDVPASSADPEAPTDADAETGIASGDGRDDRDGSPSSSATESWVDVVA